MQTVMTKIADVSHRTVSFPSADIWAGKLTMEHDGRRSSSNCVILQPRSSISRYKASTCYGKVKEIGRLESQCDQSQHLAKCMFANVLWQPLCQLSLQ
jgi:hypothetical protein